MTSNVIRLQKLQLGFTDGERHNGQPIACKASIFDGLIKTQIGIAINGGDDGAPSAGAKPFQHFDLLRPIMMPKGHIKLRQAINRKSLGFQKRAQKTVGCTGIDIVGADEEEPAEGAAGRGHQIVECGNGLLVWCVTQIKHVRRLLFTLILQGIEQQRVGCFDNRNNGFAGGGGPAAENRGHVMILHHGLRHIAVKRWIRGRIEHGWFEGAAEQAASCVNPLHLHQNHIAQRGFVQRHGAAG